MLASRSTDAILWALLSADILLAEAEHELPLPPRVPLFARETARPGKVRS